MPGSLVLTGLTGNERLLLILALATCHHQMLGAIENEPPADSYQLLKRLIDLRPARPASAPAGLSERQAPESVPQHPSSGGGTAAAVAVMAPAPAKGTETFVCKPSAIAASGKRLIVSHDRGKIVLSCWTPGLFDQVKATFGRLATFYCKRTEKDGKVFLYIVGVKA